MLAILRDPETFSSYVRPEQVDLPDMPPSMLFSDPPMHTRLRGLIAKAFTPRVVEIQRPAIQEYSDDLIDKMLARSEPDIVTDLAYPLPVMVIANMLGVAGGDLATFKRWSDDIIENIASVILMGDVSGLDQTRVEFDGYFKQRLEELRAKPEESLLSELVHVETEDGRLTEEELLMFCRLLLVAGNETTTGLIVNALERLRSSRRLLTMCVRTSACCRAPSRRRCATTRRSRARSARRRVTSSCAASRSRRATGSS